MAVTAHQILFFSIIFFIICVILHREAVMGDLCIFIVAAGLDGSHGGAGSVIITPKMCVSHRDVSQPDTTCIKSPFPVWPGANWFRNELI